MNTLGVPEDMPIENSMVSKAIEQAQKKWKVIISISANTCGIWRCHE
jgi:hypothetical protein